MKATRRSFAATAVALVLLTTTACGLGDNQEHAERIHSTLAKATSSKSARGTVTYELTPDASSVPAAAAGQSAGPVADLARLALAPSTLSVQVDFDFAKGDALVRVPSADPAVAPEPSVIFRSDTIFAKRTKLRSGERRVWAKLDLGELPEDEPRPSAEEIEGAAAVRAAAHTINPAYLTQLAMGALAGSVKELGPETLHLTGADGAPVDVQATKYESNISLDRAFVEQDLDEDELLTRKLVLRLLLGYVPDVRPAEFWLDDEGRLRQATFDFAQRVSRNESRELRITVVIPEYGAAVEIPLPHDDETVEVERYGRMVRASMAGESS